MKSCESVIFNRFVKSCTLIMMLSTCMLFAAADNTTPVERYLKIEKMSRKWVDGYFGSTLFYESQLDQLIWQEMGKVIETPFDYLYIRPFETGYSTFNCSFYYAQWMQIRGYLNDEAARKLIAESLKDKDNGWVRSGLMVSLKGRIKNFTIDRTFTEKRLILYLDGITLSEQKSTSAK